MTSRLEHKRSNLLVLVVCLAIIFISAQSYAGVIDDATRNVIRDQTGVDLRTPSIVVTEYGVKPAINGTAQWLVSEGDSLYSNPPSITILPPVDGVSPGIPPEAVGAFMTTGGRVIQGSMLVIKVYDTGNSAWHLPDTSMYDNTATTDYIAIDKTLQTGEVVAGSGELYYTVVYLLTQAGVYTATAAELAALKEAIIIYGGTKLVLKITRAVIKDADKLGLGGGSFEVSITPQKLPPNVTWDPFGLLTGGKPGVYVSSFNRPSRYSNEGSIPFGYWIPANRIKGDPAFYNVINRISHETGVKGHRQELPNPGVTGVEVYKPNIYLYHPENGKVRVSLLYEDMITTSEPRYKAGYGWEAFLKDGSINGTGDFLFYEANVPDDLFQKKTGWVIRGGHLRDDIFAILSKYGFNDREKTDFIEYWCNKLEAGMSYVFYDQNTDTVDAVMPIKTERTFHERHRIWFFIEPLRNQVVSEPVFVDVIKQHENALVEWGGIMK